MNLRGGPSETGAPALVGRGALPPCIHERATNQWHVAYPPGNEDFQPILCHPSEGINLPGHRVERQPTCVECYRIWRESRLASDEEER